jgi:hypothetical protein
MVAGIHPSGSRWLPWPGRMSRWWYEVGHVTPEPCEQLGTPRTAWTDAYGEAFTLRSAIRRAYHTMDATYERLTDSTTGTAG